MYFASNKSEYCECCACKNIECKCVKACSCVFKYSCKGIQKKGNKITYSKFEKVLNGGKDTALNTGFRYHQGVMKLMSNLKVG